jgi:hypothetical protein
MSKHEGCKMPTPAQAHCSVCHRTFSGVTGFDRHRKNGQCLEPSALGMTEVNRVWRALGKPAAKSWGGSTEDS